MPLTEVPAGRVLRQAMPQQPEAKDLHDLTEVPGGWPLATVIDAFVNLAAYCPSHAPSDRALEAVSHRLVELWAAQPAEAEAWLERCRELYAKELAGKETRPEQLFEALLLLGAAECGKYWSYGCRFSEAGLLRGEPLCLSAAQRESRAARYLQQPHVRDRCRELAERLGQAESPETARKRQKLEEETSERRRLEAELQKSQEEKCRDLRNRLAAAEAEVSFKAAELQTAQSESAKCKAVLQDRCQQLQQQLAKAQGQMQVCWEEKGKQKQRIRELEHQLFQAMQRDSRLFPGATVARLGDGSDSSASSNASWFMVGRGTVKPYCFMTDAVFKTRGYGMDFFLMGRDLKKGSQVVAGDDLTLLEVAKTPEICEAGEVVELKAGDAVLQVTPDHLVKTGEPEESVYRAAGRLKVGDFVMLDSGDSAALTSVVNQRRDCKVMKIQFQPDLPVAVFSRPTCILSGRSPKVPRSAEDSVDGASIPDTTGDYMD